MMNVYFYQIIANQLLPFIHVWTYVLDPFSDSQFKIQLVFETKKNDHDPVVKVPHHFLLLNY